MDNNEIDDIIRENSSWLRSFVRGRVGNSDDADDIVQDTLYQLVRTLNALDNPIAHVSSWLYTVAHNLIINHGRRRREVTGVPDSESEERGFMNDLSEIMMADDDDNPDFRLLRKMVWEELDRALAELPPEQREAIVLTELQGLTVKEAAQHTGVGLSTFLSRKHYAVLHVRKRLFSLYQELIKD